MSVTDHIPKLKPVPQRGSPSFTQVAMCFLAGLSGLMLAWAVPALIDAVSFADYTKAALLGFGGAIVAYTTTRLAVERGAPLSAMGFVGAKVASLLSMALVGSGLFAATYAGLTIEKIEDLRMREFARDVIAFVDVRDRQSAAAGRIVPVMESITADLETKETCEAAVSCVSGHGTGGRGSVTRALAGQRQRAESILREVRQGTQDQGDALRHVNQGLEALSQAIDAPELTKSERRAALQAAGSKINQGLNELDEAIPTALIAAYGDELQRPVTIPGKRDGSEAVSRLLSGYGDSLNAVLQSVETRDDARPGFPAPTGVTDTFAYIGHFLPIAAIVAVIELIFPITLWLYTFFALVAQVHDGETATPPARRGRPPASHTKGA